MFPYSLNLGDMISEYMTSFFRSIFSFAGCGFSLSACFRTASSCRSLFPLSGFIYCIYQVNA